MKICAIICEFNPFHNGHKYLLERAKTLSGCDAVLCLMSGSFTQRGDICIMDKYDRARHAVLCGADGVLELPSAFSVAPAEVFAAGAVKLLNSIPAVDTLAFGCESGVAEDFLNAAELLLNESAAFKEILKESLNSGESYIKSYRCALEECGGNAELLSRPNAILGVEYTKAILRRGSKIKILPVKRLGADYDDGELKNEFSSASAIRRDPENPLVKDNVPPCVLHDLKDFSSENELFERLLRYELLNSDGERLKDIYGCGEGLENAILNCAYLPLSELIAECTSRRYSSSRIKRILTANLLKLYRTDCEKYLDSLLYLKPLTVKKDCADGILAELSRSEYPLILKKRDAAALENAAKKCFESDLRAYSLWNFIVNRKISDFDYFKII